MKINKNNTIPVAILTENGAPFSKEGVAYVRTMIVEKHPELESIPILTFMARSVEKPERLSKVLEAQSHMFVIVSHNGGEELDLYHFTSTKEVARSLYDVAVLEPDMTSWEVFAKWKGGC